MEGITATSARPVASARVMDHLPQSVCQRQISVVAFPLLRDPAIMSAPRVTSRSFGRRLVSLDGCDDVYL